MVEEIVALCAELDLDALRHGKVLVDTHIEFPHARGGKRVPADHVLRKGPEAGAIRNGVDIATVRSTRCKIQVVELVRIRSARLCVPRMEYSTEHHPRIQERIR